ncbi:hypothetical protein [Hoylesella buccalis]|uniref:Vitellogenin II n=1 Tax=Hoylesella buccalis DNF00853 TaxID=1401074 RepID=A0A095ZHZ9_9BACT|nr:hypothetical protein [Hoylesella buccalis]KGF34001.1 hypothetical protein HMPREF2137_09400 [Hoylesella buccalis DNF00853]
MKKLILFTLLLGMMPYKMLAQDDMYILPSNLPTAKKPKVRTNDREVTYSGSNRDVDEYNRHGKYWSHYQKIGTDNRGNDVIEFQKGRGVYPDSTYIDTTFVGKYYDTMVDGDDFEYTSRMSRWDGFYNPWFYSSYRWRAYPYWRAGWGFYDPWYDPWYYGYTGFYDPWYNPWYYGYSGWYGSYYGGWYNYPYGGYGRGYARVYGGNPRGLTGDRTWRFGGSGDTYSTGRFARGAANGNRQSGSTYTTRSRRNRSFGGRTDTPRTNSFDTRSNSSFGNSTRSTPSYNSGSFGGTRSSGGGFGGGHSSGGGFGGGHSSGGGGGHFGGGRR